MKAMVRRWFIYMYMAWYWIFYHNYKELFTSRSYKSCLL